jgi:hypothetical protein
MKKTFYNAYCPICKRAGRKKLLFKATSDTEGTINAFCKACRHEVIIELGKESLRADD